MACARAVLQISSRAGQWRTSTSVVLYMWWRSVCHPPRAAANASARRTIAAHASAFSTSRVAKTWLNGDADCQIGCGVIWMGSEGDPYPEGAVLRTFDSGSSWHTTDFNDDLFIRLWAGQHSCENFSCEVAP